MQNRKFTTRNLNHCCRISISTGTIVTREKKKTLSRSSRWRRFRAYPIRWLIYFRCHPMCGKTACFSNIRPVIWKQANES